MTTVVSVQKSTQFANDCALMEQMESVLQITVNKFAEVSHPFSLTIRFRKKEVLFQYNPPTTDCNRSINIEGTELKNVEEFKYLGSIISNNGSLNKEINTRTCKSRTDYKLVY